MEFRRINGLPPYVFAAINQLRDEARHAGDDVIDLGFGNPDIPSPPVAVEKLAEAARNPRNHRYSSSRGLPNLRLAVSNLYKRRFGVEGIVAAEPAECIAGAVLQGHRKPHGCPAFGIHCTPERPLGAPMVSSEGACAAYYRYRRKMTKLE